ncbi:hypothetical protein JB92DRAFT_3142907 [Gautieria morchelliformis]|nr:hypothetical protein JB92DRAFT_3142907 [Gautieria morchelliformis]
MAAGKFDGQDDVSYQMRHNMVKAFSDIGTQALKVTNHSNWQYLNNYSDCLNLPRIGIEDNFAWMALQVNFASAQPTGSDRTLYPVNYLEN